MKKEYLNWTKRSMKEILLITDGSCLKNPGGPGAWACLLRYQNVEKLFSGSVDSTTNNRMEILAVIEGLRHVQEPCKIQLLSDSQYVVNAFHKKWLDGWARRNWVTASGTAVKNIDLWKILLDLTIPHEITWQWVRGHAGHADQERVDELALTTAKNRAAVLGWTWTRL